MKVGLVIPLAEDEVLGRALHYRETRRWAQKAEAMGLDSIWVYDHLLHRFPGKPTVGFWEAWTVLSALAEVTSKCSIGTLVLCTAFRNPAVLAKMAVTLNEVSDGRLILGLGAGWHRPEFEAFGIPFDHRVARFEEALGIIVPLVRSGRVDFRGTYYQAPNCEIQPWAGHKADLPIMVAARGPRMLRLAARHADIWNTDWLGPLSQVAEQRAALREACAQVGRELATLEISGGITIAYPELGQLPAWINSPDQFVSGFPKEIAECLYSYEQLGVTHVMCSCYPVTLEVVSRLGDALKEYHDMVNEPEHHIKAAWP